MATVPRKYIIPKASLFEVTWTCHNDTPFFISDVYKSFYYNALLRYKKKYHIQIYSYCFGGKSPYLTGYCNTQSELSNFFRDVNSGFAKFLNKQLGRKGQVVMDRFKSPKIQTFEILTQVMLAHDIRPLEEGLIENLEDFEWSSYRHYAYGIHDPLVTEPRCYKNLGKTPLDRQKAYRQLVCEILAHDIQDPKKFKCWVYSIGDPLWVIKRSHEIREKMKNIQRHKQKILMMRRRKITTNQTPLSSSREQ